MPAPVETLSSYGALLVRLLPKITHSMLAGPDGKVLWASDPGASPLLLPTLAILSSSTTGRPGEIDGLADPSGAQAGRFGFRIRGALGELLGLVVFSTAPELSRPLELCEVHGQIKPALDCLQSELSARASLSGLNTAPTDGGRNLDLFRRLSAPDLSGGADALGQVACIALEYLPGLVAAVLLPDRNLAICRTQAGPAGGIEAGVLSQLHAHLLTRAQLHRRTLVANRLQLDGSSAALPYKVISTPICDELRRVVGVLAVFRLDTAGDFEPRDAETLELLARKTAEIARASFDSGTGLLTQAAFVAQAKAKLAAQSAASAGSSGLLYVDIDQLNVVNENHGMPVGDELIQSVAALLSRRARGGTLLARIAGDRFAMFVPGCSIEPVARIAEEIRAAAVKLSGARGDKPMLVSLSIGVSRISERDRSLEQALAGAELACRTAKDRGRNRVEVFYGDDPADSAGRGGRRVEALVSAAMAVDSLELLAQPILPLGSAPSDPRFEILMRLRAADGTRLSFEKLTGPAASPELVRRIDRWVIERALARLAANRTILRRHPAQFSLNLSAESVADAEFWRLLEELLRGADLDPGSVAFEFSEQAAGGRIDMIARHMHRIRDLGVSFAVDNFGRGIGSLSNLNALPVQCIKIDGAFSRDLVFNPRSQSMVVAITKMAQAFGIETVASQVETDAIRARAAQLGADFGQGFFIGKPLDLDDVIRDLPLYSCFATSTGMFDAAIARTAMLNG